MEDSRACKAAFTNFTFYSWHAVDFGVNFRGNIRFDDQDVFEVVEVATMDSLRAATAERLLKETLQHLDNTHGYDTELFYSIRTFLGMD